MKTIAEIKKEIHAKLINLYPKGEIDEFIFMIFYDVCKLKRTSVLAFSESIIGPCDENRIGQIVERLYNWEPIQHILGYSHFYENNFIVNSNVLIPRQETEELVDWILSDIEGENKRIIDIGTGSGAIAISLKKNRPGWNVTGVDISNKALETAMYNAKNIGAEITFLNENALSNDFMSGYGKFDIVVSNPPYVRNSEKVEMEANVVNREPHLALFVEDSDPLIFYRKIAEWGKFNINNGGFLFYEINRAFGVETVNMLYNMGYNNVELRKDLFGNDRMIKATL